MPQLAGRWPVGRFGDHLDNHKHNPIVVLRRGRRPTERNLTHVLRFSNIAITAPNTYKTKTSTESQAKARHFAGLPAPADGRHDLAQHLRLPPRSPAPPRRPSPPLPAPSRRRPHRLSHRCHCHCDQSASTSVPRASTSRASPRHTALPSPPSRNTPTRVAYTSLRRPGPTHAGARSCVALSPVRARCPCARGGLSVCPCPRAVCALLLEVYARTPVGGRRAASAVSKPSPPQLCLCLSCLRLSRFCLSCLRL